MVVAGNRGRGQPRGSMWVRGGRDELNYLGGKKFV